ncbi:MAG: hypothetical protein IPF59_09590 [Ignavibacteria bacterium]|nr:hypothetical protein [Ignavibacteria bacterium]
MYALGADDLIVGISGFTACPPQARKRKLKVSTYLEMRSSTRSLPCVLGRCARLVGPAGRHLRRTSIRRGIDVVCFNHRSVD